MMNTSAWLIAHPHLKTVLFFPEIKGGFSAFHDGLNGIAHLGNVNGTPSRYGSP